MTTEPKHTRTKTIALTWAEADRTNFPHARTLKGGEPPNPVTTQEAFKGIGDADDQGHSVWGSDKVEFRHLPVEAQEALERLGYKVEMLDTVTRERWEIHWSKQ